MNENIVKLNYKDKEIYLVKTAHVSKNSVLDVDECVNEINPDAIAIELDAQRYDTLTNKDKWRDTDIVKIIKEKQVGYLLVNVILSSFQKRMAKSMDSTSGAEMMEGIKLSKERNLELVLADRPIKTTFKRIWSKLGTMEKSKLIVSIISSVFDDEEISEEELEKLKEADALEAALSEVGKEFPMVKHVLVDERDMYLAQKIKSAKGKKVVAIIGAAHANGIARHLEEDINTNELEVIEQKSTASKLVKWLIPLAIVGMLIYTVIANKDAGIEQIKSWVVWNGGMSLIAVLLCMGHPLSALAAFVTAPFTSLNPILSSGLFAGLVEAMLKKPKVSDFEDISTDTENIKGFLKNRVTRILLIVIITNLFSSIGTFVSGIGIFKTFLDIL
ncbi:MAG: TraB/GumN family protein [bacterium]|nr:TraB/GumN family protein [bacterium]